ncbi:unnamed protein product [Sphagnum jensenii]
MPQHRAHHSAHLGDHILDIFLLLRKLLPFQGIFEGGVAVVSDLLLEESASGRAQEGFVNEKQIDMEPCSMNHHSSMICRTVTLKSALGTSSVLLFFSVLSCLCLLCFVSGMDVKDYQTDIGIWPANFTTKLDSVLSAVESRNRVFRQSGNPRMSPYRWHHLVALECMQLAFWACVYHFTQIASPHIML